MKLMAFKYISLSPLPLNALLKNNSKDTFVKSIEKQCPVELVLLAISPPLSHPGWFLDYNFKTIKIYVIEP